MTLAGCGNTTDGRASVSGGSSLAVPGGSSDPATGITPARTRGDGAGSLVIAGSSGASYAVALRADSGAVAWQYALESNISLTSAAIGPDGVYLLDEDGYLHLVGRGGSRIARVALPQRGPSLVSTTPLVLADQVFVNNWDAAVYAYAAADLSERSWRYNTTDDMELRTSPAGAGHAVFIGTHNGYVVAFSDADGGKLWSFHAKDAVGSPVVTDQLVIVTLGKIGLLALDRATGTQRWFLDDGWYSTPQTAGDQLLVGHDTAVDALSPDGTLRWSAPVRVDRAIDGPVAAPTSGGGLVFTVQEKFTATNSPDTSTFTGNPQALDATTGKRRWIRTDLVAQTSARFDDGRLYLGLSHPQSGGRPDAPAIACLDANTGATLWQTDTDGYPTIAPLLV